MFFHFPTFISFLAIYSFAVLLVATLKTTTNTHNIFKSNIFIYFWLHWVFVAVRGLSLVAMSGGYSFLAVRRLLVAVASLVEEHGL